MDSDKNTKKTDKELVEEFQAGSLEAFDELISSRASGLFQVAYGLLGNREDAEEVVQDAFVRAYKALDKFRGDSSFDTWIRRIVINLSRNKYHWNRRRGSEQNVSISQKRPNFEDNGVNEDMMIPDKKFEPDRMLESAEFEKGVVESFEKLPETLKETMTLRHIDELPYEKIADLLDCKVGTIKSRLARGREILRNLIKGPAGSRL